MALLGGAGNPVGGSFTGPAEALEITGDFAYAYSGVAVTINDGYLEMLKFTTGNFVFVGELTMVAMTVDNDPAAGSRSNFKTTLNNSVVMNVSTVTGQGSAAANGTDVAPIIIPPYTEVIVSNRAAATGYHVFVTMAGRIYRG